MILPSRVDQTLGAFGRWRGWIEKRAAERYADITPEERQRRRERGWGNDESSVWLGPLISYLVVSLLTHWKPVPPGPGQPAYPGQHLTPQTAGLSIQTRNISFPEPQHISPPLPPLPFVSSRIRPSHLKVNQFGSRFLPHAVSQIRCLLPLVSDSLLLIGHDDGLSVMDMYPTERSETGEITLKGPADAEVRHIWKGESIHQIDIVEAEDVGDGTPHGVALVLTGQDGDSTDSCRSIRMYNLASLISLAKWAAGTKPARPLDLHQSAPPNIQQQSPPRKFRPQSGIITRGLKSLIDPQSNTPTAERCSTSFRSAPSPVAASPSSSSPLDSWDVIDELPLRWATDFVSLTSNGSRLNGSSIISYALWVNTNRRGKGGRLLAVATKTAIYLYETPKGERAFRYVKEFYTPLPPRSISFIQQSVEVSSNHHKRTDSASTIRASSGGPNLENPSRSLTYGTQLSLFVIFDKRASWIRIVDSAVGEVELYGQGSQSQHDRHHARDTIGTTLSGASLRLSRLSFESNASSSSGAPRWITPERCECPKPGHPGATVELYFLTHGKTTHIVPCPLPANVSHHPPLKAIAWNFAPSRVSARVCQYPNTDPRDDASVHSFLQLTAFGEKGLEIQEISLAFLTSRKGKERLEEPVKAYLDFSGWDAGYLCTGGRWDQPWQRFNSVTPQRTPVNYFSHNHYYAHRSQSTLSMATSDTLASDDLTAISSREIGFYGWYRKDLADWRVFWVGGSTTDEDNVPDDASQF
ncbi:hypothetical protein AX16_001899 [Volvariella volvacea WC 439]|nr:hypothetical protein AX16_001899 [Volvariella volvacea WC 439]